MRLFSDTSIGHLTSGFNPRTREDATVKLSTSEFEKIVSIHAPARMRLKRLLVISLKGSFNPRTREDATIDVR